MNVWDFRGEWSINNAKKGQKVDKEEIFLHISEKCCIFACFYACMRTSRANNNKD